MMATNDDRDVFVDECTENNIENDLPHADSEGEVNEVVDAVLDNGEKVVAPVQSMLMMALLQMLHLLKIWCQLSPVSLDMVLS
ncbi:hypothetical protein WN943_003675 [Citrus x changshan-huyou]